MRSLTVFHWDCARLVCVQYRSSTSVDTQESDQFQDYNYICPTEGNMVKTRSKVLKEEQWEKEYLFARPSDEEI
jgi:hypothetical protein